MKVYDLHTHVIPPNLIDVLLKTPERFGVRNETSHGVRVVERDGAIVLERSGSRFAVQRELFDVEAKLAAMDQMKIDVSVLSVAPPIYFYELDAEAGLGAFDLEDAEFKREAAEIAATIAVVATSEKLATAAPFTVMPAARLSHLVVEADAPSSLLDPFAGLGIAIHRASAP